jgi:hypothetical protein
VRRTHAAICLSLALVVAACSGSDASPGTTAPPATSAPTADTAPADTTPSTEAPDTAPDTSPESTDAAEPTSTPADAATEAAVAEQTAAEPVGCDVLDTRQCVLPYPSNAYLVDGRVAIPSDGLPANADGIAIDPAEWNRNDGFSPNTPLLTHIAGLDADASNLPSWTDLDASLTDDASVVLVDEATGERVPLWAELDQKAGTDDERLLMVHPAVVLTEGATYAVGFRSLVDTDGAPIEPTAVFRAYRDNLITTDATVEARRPAMDGVFAALTAAGMDRGDIQLAWDFTVATTDGIAGRMLHIRDDALAQLGDASPAFTITSVTPGEEGSGIASAVLGTFTVPNYLTRDGGPANRFFYGDGVTPTGDELPVQNGTIEVGFRCNIGDATAAGTEPAHLVQYGHGLLGGDDEINAGNVRAFANEWNVVFCATKWAGMSEDDIGNAAATLAEFSNFPTMADRLQQGVLNQIFLGRLMIRPDGLVSDPAFQRADGSPIIDTAHLDYDGNSQGGIMGMMLAAVSPDIERAVLGVVGMNYSLLLPRSVDFETYEAIMTPAYPSELDRLLIISVVQMLWDRGEGAGYVQHLANDPYPGTEAKDVLLDVAFGDWQVSELTAMIAARTMGATIHRPVTAEGRSREVEPGWGLESTTYPSDSGSAIIVWDSGSDPIPVGDVPPSTGRDPHEDPRADADVRTQKASFLFDDVLIDVCGGDACTADARD